MAEQGVYTASDVARVLGVCPATVKLLTQPKKRKTNEIPLPAFIDPRTGTRYWTAAQMAEIRAIAEVRRSQPRRRVIRVIDVDEAAATE